jgi:acyl-CoA reductase-like NAD-dependent aldehyde dehydrogenase
MPAMAQHLIMSGDVASSSTSEHKAIDRAVAELKDKAREFARLPVASKAKLLRECIPRLVDAAEAWAAAGARAKGLEGHAVGEEWTAGPWVTVRMMRLLSDSLDAVAAHGKPPLGTGTRVRADGRIEIQQMPISGIDKVAFGGFSGHALMQEGIDEAEARRRQAGFYDRKDPEGKVSLILGAGNVSSIPPMDVFTKMFIDGEVCVLKMNPVNEWVGPILERVLKPMIDRGYLRVVYGGGDIGAYLAEHEGVDTIHITGSDRTHDLIVWGPPGADRDRRMAENKPKNARPITSELGNVSPVAVVPYAYSEGELWFQAQNVVSMVANNGSFNCNAAKMVITAEGWPQREKFLGLIAKALGEVPTRKAYYPGAQDRYEKLVGSRDGVERFGEATKEKLAWALVRGVDSKKHEDPLFNVEPFCGILSETSLGSSDPAEFLKEATSFMNDVLWGTLNAALVIHPKLEADPTVAKALDKAIVDLRYGTVAINHWPGICYGFGSTAWGGHPSATLKNIQSGLGWVHNTFLLDGIEKSVVRGPLVAKPKPPWFYDFKKGDKLGPKTVSLDADPSWLKLPGLIINAL